MNSGFPFFLSSCSIEAVSSILHKGEAEEGGCSYRFDFHCKRRWTNLRGGGSVDKVIISGDREARNTFNSSPISSETGEFRPHTFLMDGFFE